MHSLVRSTIRLFAMCPIQGGWDCSWHDLYHSVADLGNQNEYSAHFIRTNASKELLTPIPEPIIVPIFGQPVSVKTTHLPTSDDENDSIVEQSTIRDKEENSTGSELYIEQRLLYTKDPNVSYMESRMQKQDYLAACMATGMDAPSGILSGTSGTKTGWHESGKN